MMPTNATGTVAVRLRGHYEDLQPALQRIAAVVLGDPAAASAMTIGDLARAAHCSEATVVRLAHELGYSGYRDFRFRLAEETAVARERRGQGTYEGDIEPGDDLAAVVGKIASADARAVHETADSLDLGTLSSIASAILQARHVAAFGVGASGLAAIDLQQKLSRIGLLATAHVDSHDALPMAALLQPGDVAIGLSHTGRTADVIDAVRIAEESGAVTVAITNAPASALAQAAEQVLVTAAHESAFRSGATASRIAQLTVIDCVFVAVAQQMPDHGRAALARTRAAVEDRRRS